MRVNVYAEEMTDRVALVTKETPEGTFTGVRFYLELPVTLPEFPLASETLQDARKQVSGPFLHGHGDDDSSAVTFWGKKQLKVALQKALELLEEIKE